MKKSLFIYSPCCIAKTNACIITMKGETKEMRICQKCSRVCREDARVGKTTEVADRIIGDAATNPEQQEAAEIRGEVERLKYEVRDMQESARDRVRTENIKNHPYFYGPRETMAVWGMTVWEAIRAMFCIHSSTVGKVIREGGPNSDYIEIEWCADCGWLKSVYTKKV